MFVGISVTQRWKWKHIPCEISSRAYAGRGNNIFLKIALLLLVYFYTDSSVMMSQNEDWKQMFGTAPIERSSLSASQKSKTLSPTSSMTLARSEKELSRLLMSVSSTEHLALTRSGSAGQLGMSSTTTITSDGTSTPASSMTRSMRQPVENTQRGPLHLLHLLFLFFCTLGSIDPEG